MKIKYLLAASVVSLSAAATIATPAAAQQITSGVEGTVTDANGSPLAGASVTITDERTNAGSRHHDWRKWRLPCSIAASWRTVHCHGHRWRFRRPDG